MSGTDLLSIAGPVLHTSALARFCRRSPPSAAPLPLIRSSLFGYCSSSGGEPVGAGVSIWRVVLSEQGCQPAMMRSSSAGWRRRCVLCYPFGLLFGSCYPLLFPLLFHPPPLLSATSTFFNSLSNTVSSALPGGRRADDACSSSPSAAVVAAALLLPVIDVAETAALTALL